MNHVNFFFDIRGFGCVICFGTEIFPYRVTVIFSSRIFLKHDHVIEIIADQTFTNQMSSCKKNDLTRSLLQIPGFWFKHVFFYHHWLYQQNTKTCDTFIWLLNYVYVQMKWMIMKLTVMKPSVNMLCILFFLLVFIDIYCFSYLVSNAIPNVFIWLLYYTTHCKYFVPCVFV